MRVGRGDLLRSIGTGFKIVQVDLTPAVRRIGPEQHGVLVDLKGHIRQRAHRLRVIFEDAQRGHLLIGDADDLIRAGCGIGGVNMESMPSRIQHIAVWRDDLDHFVVSLADAADRRKADLVGTDSIDQCTVLIHLKDRAGQRRVRGGIDLQDLKARFAHIREVQVNILAPVPVDGLNGGIPFIAARRCDFRYAIGAVGEAVRRELDHAVRLCSAFRDEGAVDLLKTEERPLQREAALLVLLVDAQNLLCGIGDRNVDRLADLYADIDRLRQLITLGGDGLCNDVALGNGKIRPGDGPVAAGDATGVVAAAAVNVELCAGQRAAFVAGFQQADASGFGNRRAGLAPFQIGHSRAAGTVGIGDDEVLLIGMGVVHHVIGAGGNRSRGADACASRHSRFGRTGRNAELELAHISAAACAQR